MFLENAHYLIYLGVLKPTLKESPNRLTTNCSPSFARLRIFSIIISWAIVLSLEIT